MKRTKTTIVSSGFIARKDRRFLIAKRAENDSFNPGYWELPGGKNEFGEDPGIGCEREVEEEVGLRVQALYPAVTMSTLEGNRHFLEIFYVCRLLSDPSDVVLSAEHSEFRWETFEDLAKFQMTEYIRSVLRNIQKYPLV